MSEPTGTGARVFVSADPGGTPTSSSSSASSASSSSSTARPDERAPWVAEPATSDADGPRTVPPHVNGSRTVVPDEDPVDAGGTSDIEADGSEARGSAETAPDPHSAVPVAGGRAPRRAVPDDLSAAALVSSLVRLRDAVTRAELPFEVEGVEQAREQRRQLLDQLDDYVLPRLVQLEAPMLAVVGGSTGAGKSTLVNSLVGRVVSEPGVLRPTTRSPVLVHHPDDAAWFTDDRILPGMRRLSDGALGGRDPGALRLIADDTIPAGLAVLDAPDVDSLVKDNRDVAAQLLAAADMWVFVTTATRYSDAVPWRFLAAAAENSTAVAMVLDRIPPDRYGDGAELIHPDTDGPSYTVSGHLGHMLSEAGLHDSPLFSLPETALDSQGLLAPHVVRPLLDWLRNLADDEAARGVVVRTTLAGAVRSVAARTPRLLPAVVAQQEVADTLSEAVTEAYDAAAVRADVRTADASLLSGEVLSHWQEFVGSGALLQGLDKQVGRVRDWVRTTLGSSAPVPGSELAEAIGTAVRAAIRDEAERAAAETGRSWRAMEAGRRVLAGADRDLERASRAFDPQCARAVHDWQQQTYERVREAAGDRRSGARFATYGINGLGVAAMVAALAGAVNDRQDGAETTTNSTANSAATDAGSADAADSAAGDAAGRGLAVALTAADVGRQVLRSVLGAARAGELVDAVRADLARSVAGLLAEDKERFAVALADFAVEPGAVDRIAAAADAVGERA